MGSIGEARFYLKIVKNIRDRLANPFLEEKDRLKLEAELREAEYEYHLAWIADNEGHND
jgi:hypothetical protein